MHRTIEKQLEIKKTKLNTISINFCIFRLLYFWKLLNKRNRFFFTFPIQKYLISLLRESGGLTASDKDDMLDSESSLNKNKSTCSNNIIFSASKQIYDNLEKKSLNLLKSTLILISKTSENELGTGYELTGK